MFGRWVAVVDNFDEVAAGVGIAVADVLCVDIVVVVVPGSDIGAVSAVRLRMSEQKRRKYRTAVRITHNTAPSRFDTCSPAEQPSLSSKPLPVPG
jgi:hypothetical protein